MNILQLILIFMFILTYKQLKISIEEIVIDIIRIIIIPIKIFINIKWKIKKMRFKHKTS